MLRSGRAKVVTNTTAVRSLQRTVNVIEYSNRRAQAVKYHAWRRFISRVRHTRPVTPPPYAESFFIKRYFNGSKVIFVVGNDDPVADLVEFGAHPRGGPTRTLGYRPLGAGVDAVVGGA